ncbi:Hypothetical protein UVM_LOCUS175 [uncultured virus]|nr:Hypothetical protein UVM_LOCUS175 [uncultured virus]
MHEQRDAVARTWSVAELLCDIAGAMDAPSLLALRSVSSFFREVLSNDERLFEAAFRRTFPLHCNTGWRDWALPPPVSCGSRWRARCVRRLRVEATHQEFGIGFSDFALDWPLSPALHWSHDSVRDDDKTDDVPLLAETLLHHLESHRDACRARLPAQSLDRILRWALRVELHDVVLACTELCASRLQCCEYELYFDEKGLLLRAAERAVEHACHDGRSQQLAHFLRVWSPVPSLFDSSDVSSASSTDRYPVWLRTGVQGAIGRWNSPVDPAVLQLLLVPGLTRAGFRYEDALATGALETACRSGRIDTVRWLQARTPHIFSKAKTLHRSILAALRQGRDDVTQLLWSSHFCRTSPRERALALAANLGRIALSSVPLFLSMLLGDDPVYAFVGGLSHAFRRFVCWARDCDCDVVRTAVRSVGYRCSFKDWHAAMDFVALRGQSSLLETLIELSAEACVFGSRRPISAPTDDMRRRMAVGMFADRRRIKLWAFARREVTATTAWADVLCILEASSSAVIDPDGTRLAATGLDATLVALCARLHENDCPCVERDMYPVIANEDPEGAYDEVPDYTPDYADSETHGQTRDDFAPGTDVDEERFVAWTCASRNNELVLDSILRHNIVPGERLGKLFRSVVCNSPNAEVARAWLAHPASDASFAYLVEAANSMSALAFNYVRPFCPSLGLWASKLARVANDDVFAVLLTDERVLPLHVECALLRRLLTETSGGDDDERIARRLQMLLRSSTRSAFACCDETQERVENVVLQLVQRRRAKSLRVLLDDGRFDLSARNNAALRMAVWLERPGERPSPVRTMLENDPRVRERARQLHLAATQ